MVDMCGVCGWSIGAENKSYPRLRGNQGKPESQYRCMEDLEVSHVYFSDLSSQAFFYSNYIRTNLIVYCKRE